MVILNEMAAAWSLYLSFGVILIFSNCACTEVTSSNEPAKKNDTSNRTSSDRNVWSVTTTKLSKHSTATMNTLKASTSLPTSDRLKMLDSESPTTKGISTSSSSSSSSSVVTEKNTSATQVRPTRVTETGTKRDPQITTNRHQSSVSRPSTIAYTTPLILRSKENQTKAVTQKDEKENLYIGFRNLFDAFKNVKKTTIKGSIENQFVPESVSSTTPGFDDDSFTYRISNANTTSPNDRKIATISTPRPIKTNTTINQRKSSTPKSVNTSPPPSTNRSSPIAIPVKPFSPITSPRPISATIKTIPTSPAVTARPKVNRTSETHELVNATAQPYQTSTFDINSLRKKFVFIGNLTAANATTEKGYLSIYDESTISVDTTPSRANGSTKKLETSTIYDLTFMDEAAIPEPAENATRSEESPPTRLPDPVSSITTESYRGTESPRHNRSIPILGPTHTTQSPAKNLTTNRTAAAYQNRVINKEHLQFPGITLKVSHVLIPKQKRSRYTIQNMKIEVPKNQLLGPPSAPTSKNSNCTRFPVMVVTASDTESKEKVNLTEEHYDCEYSPEPNNTQKEPAVVPLHTYFGGYVFRYTLPKVPANVSVSNQTTNHTARSTASPSSEDTDDYYSSYMEYSDPTNGSSSSGVEDGIFPDPDMRKTISETKPEALSIPSPDASLTDSDLHDHDVIDSVMYIYFGGATHGQRGAGRQIIIVGAVIALVAQFLTLASSIRRIKTHKGEEPTIILLNIETALTLTNLIFILGVQSTSDHTICKVIAASLYYLHIATLFWFLLSSVHSLQTVCQLKMPFKFFTLCILGWMSPVIVAMLSYVFNERSFETNLYCWVSPLRGILISYILPVILLCIICIVLTVIGLKNVTDTTEDFDDTYSHKKLLRISAVALPLFSVIWFTGMVSLENSASLLFSLIFLISDTILNWLLFACWLPSEASQWKDMDEDYYDEEEDFDDEPVLAKRRFDDQPLLSELYEYGAQGQLYNLRVEPISIIST